MILRHTRMPGKIGIRMPLLLVMRIILLLMISPSRSLIRYAA